MQNRQERVTKNVSFGALGGPEASLPFLALTPRDFSHEEVDKMLQTLIELDGFKNLLAFDWARQQCA